MDKAWRFGAVLLVAAMMALVVACSPQGTSGTASSSQPPASSSSTVTESSSAQTPDTVMVPLDYNAGTGFEWTCTIEPEGVVEQIAKETEDQAGGQPISGGPLRDLFTFKAAKPGEVTLTFELAREWEDGDPAETQVYSFVVGDDLKMTLNPYKSNFNNEPEWVSGQ